MAREEKKGIRAKKIPGSGELEEKPCFSSNNLGKSRAMYGYLYEGIPSI
ncbi:hypothetical protein [Sphaerochaeta pleomorpha]|nr:hypothetical protein [Sphaerochaeta pleomorpha]